MVEVSLRNSDLFYLVGVVSRDRCSIVGWRAKNLVQSNASFTLSYILILFHVFKNIAHFWKCSSLWKPAFSSILCIFGSIEKKVFVSWLTQFVLQSFPRFHIVDLLVKFPYFLVNSMLLLRKIHNLLFEKFP